MADENSTPHTPPAVDEEYKTAIQPVIDNNMRTDILGPHFCRVITTHTPASDAIVDLIAKKIASDPELKKAVKQVVDEHNKESKMGWVNKAIGAAGAIFLALIIWGIEYLITHPHHTPSP